MKSILQDEKRCYICGSTQWLERHHVMNGYDRDKSEKYGLTVYLCHYCHNEPPNGVHYNRKLSDALKRVAQERFDEVHGNGAFFKEFGKNYK